MERTLTIPSAALIQPTVHRWRRGLRSVLPLWRHLVWMLALFVVVVAWVQIRLDVQQVRQELDRNSRMQREATILNDRLRLEDDARRRALAVELMAARMSLSDEATVVRVVGD